MTLPRSARLERWEAWVGGGLAVLFGLVGARRVALQVSELVSGSATFSAGDLALRHQEVTAWFAGVDVYATFPTADYPPASYAILWPWLGWLDLPGARLLWAILCCGGLLVLSWIAARSLGSAPRSLTTLAAVLPWGSWPSAQSIALGQLGVPCLAAILATTVLGKGSRSAPKDAAIALLLTAALVKPSLTLPLVAVLALRSGASRPAWIAGCAYAALTLVANAAQPSSQATLMTAWIGNSGAHLGAGYGNLATWLSRQGWEDAVLPAAALPLGGLIAWELCGRPSDLWRTLTVAAVVARTWTYHYLVDDVLLLIPATFLLRRIATAPRSCRVERAAFLLCCAALLAPTALRLSPTWSWAFEDLQITAYLGSLLVAVWSRESSTPPAACDREVDSAGAA